MLELIHDHNIRIFSTSIRDISVMVDLDALKISKKSGGYDATRIRMNSVWFTVDPDACRAVRGAACSSRDVLPGCQAPVLGIFTDDPVEIARRLPRPLTPFVPSPESDGCESCDGSSNDFCDSAGTRFGDASLSSLPYFSIF
jgi:hypothetical protein